MFGLLTNDLGTNEASSRMVIAHAESTRHDLLILDPQYGEDGGSLELDWRYADYLETYDPKFVGFGGLERFLERSGLGRAVSPEVLLTATEELVENRTFGIAVFRAPPEMPTCSLSPAIPLRDDDAQVAATLGTILSTDSGGLVATTANHAVDPHQRAVFVDGRELRVSGRHEPSDSCLLSGLSHDSIDRRTRKGLRGPLRSFPPAPLRPAFFDGGSSGPKDTRVTGHDPSVIDPQEYEMSKIYTDADTLPGDSGAALVNEDDQIIGFAWRRTRYDAPVQYSVWVWAEMVYEVQGLLARSDPP